MAEDLPCSLGFQFLNVETDKKSDFQLDTISTKKNNARSVYMYLSEQDRNQQSAEVKATKSSTTSAVKVFKGIKERRKTNYFITNERNHCQLK